jgi:RimJ/RimL family protein N-acetyltransferase
MCSYQRTTVIPTPRLQLRPLTPADAPRIAQYASDFDVAKMTTRMPHPYALDDARNFVERVHDPLAANEAVFGVESAEDGLIGAVGFHAGGDLNAPEFGYWIGKPWWGKGYATEAARAALAWAKTGWGRKVVFAGHFADNPASAAVLIKSGFLYTGDVKPLHSAARGEAAPTRMMVWLA